MRCESTVYLNKIFSDSKIKSCPLLTDVTIDSTDFTQSLTFFDDCCDNRCCCSPVSDAEAALTYTVDCVQVSVTNIEIPEASALAPANVSVNGIDVDSLTLAGNIYSAGTADLMNQVSNQMCMCKGLDTAGYFLITGAGPWNVALVITVYGVAEGCGTSKRFKLVFTSRPGTTISVPGTSTFAISRLCLPCTTMGISPVINFSFGGMASILSPVITAPVAATPCALTLTGSLVLEPTANVYVTRQTLFKTNADLVYTPCDDLIPVPKPPCSPCCKEDCHIHIGEQSECNNGCGSHTSYENSVSSCSDYDRFGCGCANSGSNGCGCGSSSGRCDCGCANSGSNGCGCGSDERWVSDGGYGCGSGDNCRCDSSHNSGCSNESVDDSRFEHSSNHHSYKDRTYQFNGCNGCSF